MIDLKVYKRSALGQSVANGMFIKRRDDEYFELYMGNRLGSGFLQLVTSGNVTHDTGGAIHHTYNLVEGVDKTLELFMIMPNTINITSYNVTITVGDNHLFKTSIASHIVITLPDDLVADDVLYIVVEPKCDDGLNYSLLKSVAYVIPQSTPVSNITMTTSPIIYPGDDVILNFTDVPTTIESYNIKVGEASWVNVAANPTITIPVSEGQRGTYLTVIIQPVDTSNTKYEYLGTSVFMDNFERISTGSSLSCITNVTLSQSLTCTINNPSPDVTKYIVKFNGTTVDVATLSKIDNTFITEVPIWATPSTALTVVPEDSDGGTYTTLGTMLNVNTDSKSSGANLNELETVILGQITKFSVQGAISDVTLFKLYVDGVLVKTSQNENLELLGTGLPNTQHVVTLVPYDRYNIPFRSVTKVITVIEAPNVNSGITTTIPVEVSIFEFADIKINGYNPNIDYFDVYLDGVKTNAFRGDSGAISVGTTLGVRDVRIIPIAKNPDIQYVPLDSVIMVVPIKGAYITRCLPYNIKGNRYTGNTVRRDNSIYGFEYVCYPVNSTEPAWQPLDREINGDWAIDVTGNIGTKHIFKIRALNTGTKIFEEYVETITIVEVPEQLSLLRVVGQTYALANTEVVLSIDATMSSATGLIVDINGGITRYNTIPSEITLTTPSVGSILPIKITPLNESKAIYTPIQHDIVVVPGYNKVSSSLLPDVGIELNIPSTVKRFENITVDIGYPSDDIEITSYKLIHNNNPPITINDRYYNTPPVTNTAGNIELIVIIPILFDGTEARAIVKEVVILPSITTVSDLHIDLPEVVAVSDSFNITPYSIDKDIVRYVITVTGRDSVVTADGIAVSAAMYPVGTYVNITVTPISVSGKIYSTTHRTVEIAPAAPEVSGCMLEIPDSVARVAPLNITWTPAEVPVDSYQLEIKGLTFTKTIRLRNNTFGYTLPCVAENSGTYLHITLTPIRTGVEYVPVRDGLYVTDQEPIQGNWNAIFPTGNVIDRGTDLRVLMEPNFEANEISHFEVKYHTSTGITTTQVDLDTNLYVERVEADIGTTIMVEVTPIANPLPCNINLTPVYQRKVYTSYVSGTNPIASDVEFGNVAPSPTFEGLAFTIDVTNNPRNITTFDVDFDGITYGNATLDLTTTPPTLPLHHNRFDYGLGDMDINIKPIEEGVNYQVLAKPATFAGVQLDAPTIPAPANSSDNINVNTSVTISGRSTTLGASPDTIIINLYILNDVGDYDWVEEVIDDIVPVTTGVSDDYIYTPLNGAGLDSERTYKVTAKYNLNTIPVRTTWDSSTTFTTA